MADAVGSMLSKIPLFAGLTPEQLDPLNDAVRRFSLKEGEVLFQKGEASDAMYLLETGSLRVFIHGPGGREVVLDILEPGDAVGEMGLIDGGPRSAYVQAAADCELLALDRKPFMDYLSEHADIAIRMMVYLVARQRQLVLQAETFTANDSSARLAHTLLFLAEKDGRIEPGLVTSSLRKKDLAAAVGTSEEWVTRTLTEWSHDGIIGMTGARRLLIHDVEALKALSHRDD